MSKEINYLFKMHVKYAPTKMVGTYECETDESNKWLDSLIIAKKKIEALEIIKKKKVFVAWLKHDLSTYNNTCALYGLPRLNQEQFNLLKEVGL